MKHCITVNYARERNAEIALSTSKGAPSPSPRPLGQLSYRFCPAALWHFLCVRHNDNGIRTRMSCDSERKVSYNYRVADRAGVGGTTGKTDEQFMTCSFCAAFNIYFSLLSPCTFVNGS